MLAGVIEAGLNAGVAPLAMREAMVQAMAYSGLPSTIRAQNILADVLKRRGEKFPAEVSATVTDATRFADGLKVQKAIFGEAINAIVVMLPFIGFPKSLNALAMVNDAAPAK